MRTFGDVLKPNMSKTAIKKQYDNNKNLFEVTPDAIERDASKQETLYELLFDSLIYTLQQDECFKFPDISKSWISETINNKKPISSEIIKAAQKQEAATFVAAYFASNIVPNIPKHLLSVVVDGIMILVQYDTSLGRKKRDSLKSARERKSEADFLADVWVLAVCRGAEHHKRKQMDETIVISSGESKPLPVENQGDAIDLNTEQCSHSRKTLFLFRLRKKSSITQKKLTSSNRPQSTGKKKKSLIRIYISAAIPLTSVIALVIVWQSLSAPSLAMESAVEAPVEYSSEESAAENVEEVSIRKPLMDVPLFRKPYIEVGDSEGYLAEGNDKENTIKIFSWEETILYDDISGYTNYATYALNSEASKFSATFNPPKYRAFEPELAYRVYGDGEIFYETVLDCDSLPMFVSIDTSGVYYLKIEVELTGHVYASFADYYFLGIQNAVITTTG